MPSTFLNLAVYDPVIPIPNAGTAFIRQEENKAYFNIADIPLNAIIRILHLTRYVFYQVIDPTAKALIMAAELNASTGIIEHIIIDESIVDQTGATARGDAALAIVSRAPLSVSFSTYVTGYRSNQQFTYRYTPMNINQVLTIQSASRTLLDDGRTLTKITAANAAILTREEINLELLNEVRFPKSARLVQLGPE